MLYNTSYVPVHDMSATGFVGRMEEICQELEASESDEDLAGGMHPTRVKQEVATERVQKESTEGEYRRRKDRDQSYIPDFSDT